MRTVEDFQAKYGYVTTGMWKQFGELCELTETPLGKEVIRFIADKTDNEEALVKQCVLDGTLTKFFIECVQIVLKEEK